MRIFLFLFCLVDIIPSDVFNENTKFSAYSLHSTHFWGDEEFLRSYNKWAFCGGQIE